MRIFNPMSLDEARKLFEELKKFRCESSLVRMCMVDILLHTNNFEHDYGEVICRK